MRSECSDTWVVNFVVDVTRGIVPIKTTIRKPRHDISFFGARAHVRGNILNKGDSGGSVGGWVFVVDVTRGVDF